MLADVRWHDGAKKAFTLARQAGVMTVLDGDITPPVSYTHLDVYKRQGGRKAVNVTLVALNSLICQSRQASSP